jgi:hypothetical protein
MWLEWLPWRYVVRHAAHAHGFIDPISIMSRVHRFAQPSEVAEPIELLRAGIVFHARGLINTKAIQHNLDWVWPYWVERQFDPLDNSFIPRAFSITHVNLTHRNWTAVGIPDCRAIPIVDPRGLVTPFFDGWSIDGWIITSSGLDSHGLDSHGLDSHGLNSRGLTSHGKHSLIPSQRPGADQQLILGDDRLSVVTTTSRGGRSLRVEAEVVDEVVDMLDKVDMVGMSSPVCRINFQSDIEAAATGRSEPSGQAWLVIALRPYNPEGISFIHKVALSDDRRNWIINQRRCAKFSTPVEHHAVSRYHDGDVYLHLLEAKESQATECDVGLATAAALFKIPQGGKRSISLEIRLSEDKESLPLFDSQQGRHPRQSSGQGQPAEQPASSMQDLSSRQCQPSGQGQPVGQCPSSGPRPSSGQCPSGQHPGNSALSWADSLKGVSRVSIPSKFQFLFDAALRTLILHSPGEVYPGPYTYKRFWFRDAAFILQAMLCVGMKGRVMRAVERFLGRQTRSGFFLSQEGEWDSNGEALWIMHQLCELGGFEPGRAWHKIIFKGGGWIKQKRLSDNNNSLQAGLLPAGFSAEHLGPNDYYYWDDFWGVAGLYAAGSMMNALGDLKTALLFEQEAKALNQAIEHSLEKSVHRRGRGPANGSFEAIPASPYRRMDAGAIGSIVASYPLRIWAPDDKRVLGTVNYLLKTCLVKGAFFQDMIHSGLNAYLTLHLAQVLLRSADRRFYDLIRAVADMASPTGQWPEAIHPQTGGGCMGDGQHVWAAAEWIMMIRNMFVREEGNRLILASGIVDEWLDQTLSFGPTLTPYGEISLKIEPQPGKIVVAWSALWRDVAPTMEIRIPGLEPLLIEPRLTEPRLDGCPSQGKAQIPRP